MKKILAFTLAEVLVVMGIIGVVAAITVPTLNNTTNEKEIVAKVNKAAADITEAYGRARAKYGRYPRNWGTGGTLIPNRVLEFMQVKTSCMSMASGSTCMKTTAKSLVTSNTYTVPYYKSALLADGMSIGFSNCIEGNLSCVSGNAIGLPDNVYIAVVDIDGPTKGFNTIGVDIFYFLLAEEGGLNTADSTLLSHVLNQEQPERTLASKLFEAPAYAIVGGPTTTQMEYKWWKYTNYILANGTADYLKK